MNGHLLGGLSPNKQNYHRTPKGRHEQKFRLKDSLTVNMEPHSAGCPQATVMLEAHIPRFLTLLL